MDDRVIVITGGGSGIGKAIAAKFAQNGDHVVIVGRTEAKLREVAGQLGTNVTFQIADVSQREQVESAIAAIIYSFNRVDVLVNNAGFVQGIRADMPLAEAENIWNAEVGTNLKGAFLMSVGCAPHLSHAHGRIINISSIAAYTGGSSGGVIGYSAAKAGLHGLTVALARELSPQGITVNTISPGLIVETEFFGSGGLSEAGIRNRVAQIPVGRPGQPDDVANVVYFLASDQASYITGEVLHVNGGWLFGH